MIKKSISIISVLSASLFFAQDIKTKKDKITLNDKEIAKFTETKKVYTIYDLDGKELVKIKPNLHVFNENRRTIYYEVTSPDNSQSVSLYNKGEKGSISLEKKFLYDFTLGEYKLFTESGVDQSVIDTMLASNLNVKAELEGKAEELRGEEDKMFDLLKASKIDFNDKGEILVNRSKKIGSIVRKKNQNGISLIYEIYNKNGDLIGKWYELESNVLFNGQKYPSVNNELLLTNGKNYSISKSRSNAGMSLSMDKLAQLITAYAFNEQLL
ncbi:hypothetical protein HNP38_000735 [Chryseobacterium defluvii]|uniref:Uncharacterized protein n=1 Tax=Chryseobacterium defluvii TaxID=160396 RepID=A0A840KD43_9FLAO|nr:hypothetical protein [Chryseobacterium defluvii]MBB4805463.1 hypothetical protein [Chryseobacterium defluvii]